MRKLKTGIKINPDDYEDYHETLYSLSHDPVEDLKDALFEEFAYWSEDELSEHAKDLGLKFPEEFEYRDELIEDMVQKIISDPDWRKDWLAELKSRN